MPDAAVLTQVGIERSRQASLRFFNLYRLVLAGILLVTGAEFGLGREHPGVFSATAFAYLGAILALGFPDAGRRLGHERVIALQVVIDIAALAVIMWTSGGYSSGMPVLMMIVLAGGGLVAEGRMVMFFAALATLAVLFENAWRYAAGGAPGDFFQVGVFCAGFFGIALVSHLLARRAQANASLAAERGEALVKQQAVNERIIRDMQDGVVVASADGRVRQANPQALALLGVGALEGRLLTDCDPNFEEVLTTCCDSKGRLLRLGPADRLLRCRTVCGDTGSAADGDVLIYLTDFEDIQRDAQQAKLAALGRLTASMAHEIRNPLAAVTQAAELLQDERRQPTQARLLRIVGDNARRIEHMIRDVLALGRRQHPHPEAIVLQSFVAEVLEERGFRSPEERALVVANIHPGLSLQFDRAHLQQILDNLLDNACRHCSGKPGAVQLVARALMGGRVALHVRDDGPGLDDRVREHLFEPFFTTHARGTGLGLYIARELAEANDAWLESGPDAPGADFVLTGRS